ncbi:MAG: DUF6044 family protein [Lachnospiraceae bacterium]|nr:DUF6044 family protein [Lachnospiraceae bacterium]
MKKFQEFLKNRWYLVLVELLLFLQAAVFLAFRDNSYIAVHDNLDLFIPHFRMMKLQNAFFSQNAIMPMLGGISRDTLGSEFSLYNILYFIFPDFAAYMIGYALKILIGFFSFLLLAKDIYKERYVQYRPILTVIALAFALIPVFPTYGIAFTSIPLLIYLLRRIDREAKWWMYLAVFCYPLISYFSYFGFFLLAYMVCAIVILWVKDKKFPAKITASLFILAAGYICFEYRLFREMLFGSTVTIRTTMVGGDYTIKEVFATIGDAFINTIFHAQDSHFYVVLPVCIIGILLINFFYIKRKEYKKILTDSCNLTFLFILFNCIIYGFYEYEPFRSLFETLLPPLKGFQFNRTLYFNSFLWYALLFLILKKMYDIKKKGFLCLANVIAVFAVLIVMFEPQVYNDFYNTCYNQAYRILKQADTSGLNYREFYSKELFDEIKEDIGYEGEWSAAYGMHPGILVYNGISTLDGYLGLYSQEYKEDFRKVIAPALDTAEEFRNYYDSWGARAYLYSGAGENTYNPSRNLVLSDYTLSIDTDSFQKLNGKYIFSRVKISNAEELSLQLKGVYTSNSSPYTIYVYACE